MLLDLQVLLVLLERVIWVRVAMCGQRGVNSGVEFLGSSCADSRFEMTGEAFEFEEATDGTGVDLEERCAFFGCGLERVLHDAVSQVERVCAGHGLVWAMDNLFASRPKAMLNSTHRSISLTKKKDPRDSRVWAALKKLYSPAPISFAALIVPLAVASSRSILALMRLSVVTSSSAR